MFLKTHTPYQMFRVAVWSLAVIVAFTSPTAWISNNIVLTSAPYSEYL